MSTLLHKYNPNESFDFVAADNKFQKLMQECDTSFVGHLKLRSQKDNELERHQFLIIRILDDAQMNSKSGRINLRLVDLIALGLPTRVVKTIGKIAMEYERKSENRELSPQNYEESYDEDFEEISEEFDESDKTAHSITNSKQSPNYDQLTQSIHGKKNETSDTSILSPSSTFSPGRGDQITSAVGTPNHEAKRRQKTPMWITSKLWKLGDKIGTGSFGEVFQAMNDKVTIKFLHLYVL